MCCSSRCFDIDIQVTPTPLLAIQIVCCHQPLSKWHRPPASSWYAHQQGGQAIDNSGQQHYCLATHDPSTEGTCTACNLCVLMSILHLVARAMVWCGSWKVWPLKQVTSPRMTASSRNVECLKAMLTCHLHLRSALQVFPIFPCPTPLPQPTPSSPDPASCFACHLVCTNVCYLIAYTSRGQSVSGAFSNHHGARQPICSKPHLLKVGRQDMA